MNVCRGLFSTCLALALAACGEGAPPPAQDPSAAGARTEAAAGATRDRWGTFRSKRFSMVLRLPGGSEWRIDDRSQPELVAVHTISGSRIVAQRWNEPDVMNHATCEARARLRNLLPPEAAHLVEESSALRPDGEDVHVWVALEPGANDNAPIRGHAVAVGARARKCWAVHYATEVASAKDEPELSARLATVREGTLSHVVIEGIEDVVPRERRGR